MINTKKQHIRKWICCFFIAFIFYRLYFFFILFLQHWLASQVDSQLLEDALVHIA